MNKFTLILSLSLIATLQACASVVILPKDFENSLDGKLFAACAQGDAKKVAEYLDAGAKVNSISAYKEPHLNILGMDANYILKTPLAAALDSLNIEVIELLIKKGAQLRTPKIPDIFKKNLKNYTYQEPLAYLIMIKHELMEHNQQTILEIVEILLESGANANPVIEYIQGHEQRLANTIGVFFMEPSRPNEIKMALTASKVIKLLAQYDTQYKLFYEHPVYQSILEEIEAKLSKNS